MSFLKGGRIHALACAVPIAILPFFSRLYARPCVTLKIALSAKPTTLRRLLTSVRGARARDASGPWWPPSSPRLLRFLRWGLLRYLLSTTPKTENTAENTAENTGRFHRWVQLARKAVPVRALMIVIVVWQILIQVRSLTKLFKNWRCSSGSMQNTIHIQTACAMLQLNRSLRTSCMLFCNVLSLSNFPRSSQSWR